MGAHCILAATRLHPALSGRIEFEFNRFSRIPCLFWLNRPRNRSQPGNTSVVPVKSGFLNRTCPPSSLLKFPLRLRLTRNRQIGLPWKRDSRNGFHLHQGAGPL